MKLKISLAFVALYLISLVLTAPASMITRFIPADAGIQVGYVSGSIWNGKLSQVDYRNQFQLQRVTWQFDWLALLTLKLKADIKFNNGRKILNGTGAVAYGFSGLTLSDVNVDMKATEIIPYLKLPVPVTPSGKFTLVIENATQDLPYCSELDGYLVWHEARVKSPMGNIDFATPSVDLSCSEGNLVASLKQHSEQLTTNANILLLEGGAYQLQGNIIGREKLDPSILQALSWLGPKDESGATALNFKGRL
ncbi:type II secretion system protein N [Psychromonas sp. psych-6C06]|uniref:type II secretion system protein N n=1 Tax=Psychromonas sp. psych-6C06 TaxID=2058089 RepID=UPI000C327FB0|nr:type II secretion system protein N [Psychromonas sp. psych-6C06]PKF61457.1 type II secretion system protein N [Psychromonas sp. psych-6C06]